MGMEIGFSFLAFFFSLLPFSRTQFTGFKSKIIKGDCEEERTLVSKYKHIYIKRSQSST